MVCEICNESYFKPGAKRNRGRGRGRGNGHRPVALSCGHTFHKRCAISYFDDGYDCCPTCNSYEDGSFLILYMNVDMDDSDAIRGPIRNNQSFDDVEQLALSMMGMGVHDNGAECVMIADLLRQNQELRSGTNGRMREELAEAKRQLRIERQRADDAQDELDEMTEKHEDLLDRNGWLEDRVDELETLSDRHRENIAGMQRSMQTKKELISDYEDRYGYIW